MPMISDTKNSTVFFCCALLLLLLSACDRGIDPDTKEANLKADSLSIKLNSPELKAVNAELLKDPNNAELYHKRAATYLMLRQLPEAVNDALRAIRIDSTRAPFYVTLADGYFAQNKTKLAKDVLESIEKKFPENSEALLKLAELYFLVQQYQKAIDYANKALKLDESLAQAYYLKGNIYRESGDTGRAISSLQTAIEQDSKMVEAYQDLGLLHASRKNPVALDYYANALRISPDNEEIKYARAKLLQDLGKADEALAEYEKIIAGNKGCAICLYNTGAIYSEVKKDYKKALDFFSKAIAVNPAYIEAYFARGYTYARLKDKASAKADYEMCTRLDPGYAPAIEGLNQL
jgi:tetratricopeptide (TPR) repeat protein